MKKIVLFILSFFPVLGFSQKIINVNFADSTGIVKDLLGGNRYFNNTAVLLHNEGIDIIRSHDIHHALDYSDYSHFWNSDGAGNYTVNENFDPYNPDDYYWLKADSAMEVIVNNGFDVFFRIGVSFPNPNITPLPPYDPPVNSAGQPHNFTRFASLTKQIYRHYNEGWDNGHNYGIEYWELWNEPGGLFWHGSPQQFKEMYKAVADSMKSYAPDIKLGAPGAVPATTIGLNPDYREDFIAYCAQNNLPLDFYSWHIYGYKNPYGIKEFADTIRSLLDINGYTQAESIISEINNTLNGSLDTFAVSPYGAAYYLSTILTAQKTSVDKLYWYPSVIGIMTPNSGDTAVTRTYFAMTLFNELQKQSPVEVYNDGDETVEGHWDSYQRNFMVLSSKSHDNKIFSVLISNFSSDISDLEINMTGLPWTESDSVLITKKIIDQNYVCKTESHVVNGNSTMILSDNNRNPSYILFYTLKNVTYTGETDVIEGKLVINSPVKEYLYLKGTFDKVKKAEIYSVSGTKVYEGFFNNKIQVSALPAGIYVVVLKDKNNKRIYYSKFIKI